MGGNQSSGQNDLHDIKLKFVRRKDDITLDDDLDILRVEMSCGHAAAPESVSGWCRSLLDQGQYTFYCPAFKHGTIKKMCKKEWSYFEVRKAAGLSDSEQAYFEEKMARLAATAEYCEFKSCPSCESYVERKDLTNLCVKCTICTAVKKKTYQFCWQCLREWKGPAAHAVCCSYEDCINPDVDKLAECSTITLSDVNNVECPSIRACPTCGLLVEHKGNNCKNLMCKRCKEEFCFLCLKRTSICVPNSDYFKVCSVAQRQTEIPVWKRSGAPAGFNPRVRTELRSNSPLRELDLTENKIGDKGLMLLSDGLKDLHCKLEKLTLRHCDITDEGCAALASALRSNSQLREVDLTKIRGEGLKLLSDGLKDPHCKLEKLTLDYTLILTETRIK